MIDKSGFIDDVFEQGGQIVQGTGKHIKNAPSNIAKTVVSQVAPSVPIPTENSPDNKKQQKPINAPAKSLGQVLKQQIKPTPQDVAKEQAELQKVRQELHQKYYQNLVNRPKPKEEAPAERVERQENDEEQKKFLEEKKKKEKELPTNIRQGTGEKQPGIGG